MTKKDTKFLEAKKKKKTTTTTYQDCSKESNSLLLLSPSYNKAQIEHYRAHTHLYRFEREAVHPATLVNFDLDHKSLQ